MISEIPGNPLSVAGGRSGQSGKLHEKATQLEATFLSEMLGYAGFGPMQGSFGGGIGEEQFSSFLRQTYADELARAGGIGLAETIFNALMKGADNA